MRIIHRFVIPLACCIAWVSPIKAQPADSPQPPAAAGQDSQLSSLIARQLRATTGGGNDLRRAQPQPELAIGQPPTAAPTIFGVKRLAEHQTTSAPAINSPISLTSHETPTGWLSSPPTDSAAQVGTAPLDLTGTLQRLVVATMTVICVGVVGLVLLKRIGFHHRMGRSGSAHAASSLAINVLGESKLGNHGQLQVVQVDDSRFLIGLDNTGVQSIVAMGGGGEPAFPGELNKASDEMKLVELLRNAVNESRGGRS